MIGAVWTGGHWFGQLFSEFGRQSTVKHHAFFFILRSLHVDKIRENGKLQMIPLQEKRYYFFCYIL